MKMRQKKEIENNTWARVVSEANEWDVELKNEKRNSISNNNNKFLYSALKLNSMRLYLQATMHYFVYHLNMIALYLQEKPTSLMTDNKSIDNPWITILECVGADS